MFYIVKKIIILQTLQGKLSATLLRFYVVVVEIAKNMFLSKEECFLLHGLTLVIRVPISCNMNFASAYFFVPFFLLSLGCPLEMARG